MNKGETRLSAWAGILWVSIQRWSSYLGLCYKTMDNLVEASGLDEEDVTLALGELESLGMIEVEYGKHYITIRTDGFLNGEPDPEPEPLEMPYAARKILDDTMLSWAEKGLALYVLANPGKGMAEIKGASNDMGSDVDIYLKQLIEFGYIEHVVLPTKGSKK